MKIGIWARQENPLWVAGSIYQENLIASLRLIDEDVSTCLLVKPGKIPPIHAEWSKDLEIVELPARTSLIDRALGRLRRTLPLRDRRLDACFRAAGIDVVFGNLLRQGRLGTPWLTRITDFQFLHLAENFSAAEVAVRKRGALATTAAAARILVSGPCVFEDFKQVAPRQTHKVSIVPFVSLFPQDYYDQDPEDTVAGYHIQHPFFLVPTQWWTHKNHRVIFEAASRLIAEGYDWHWVFTGTLYDHRAPDYYSELLQQIAALGLQRHVTLLGFLPREQQVQLLRAADCIVQASLFEGFSISVEDAKTLGQRIVLSDIPAHRERNPENALFFDPTSPQELTEKLITVARGELTPKGSEDAGRQAAIARARKFGGDFYAACRQALA